MNETAEQDKFRINCMKGNETIEPGKYRIYNEVFFYIVGKSRFMNLYMIMKRVGVKTH